MVSRWFSRRFATAMALVWAGGSAGGLVLSPVTEALAASLEWRNASLVIAASVVVATLIAALLARGPSSPAEAGFAPDGDAISPEAMATSNREEAKPAGARGGLKSINPFIALVMFVAIAGDGMMAIAVLSQQPAFLEGAGISPSNAALVLGLTSGGCFLGAATIGWLLDRFRGVWSSLLVISTIAVGLLVLAILGSTPSLVISILGGLCLGYGVGAAEVLWITMTKRQFGEALFPITYGGWYFSLQVGYAIGGGVGGLGIQLFGALGFLVLVGAMYLPAAISSLLLRAARKTGSA
ncbi:MAG: MFS transporter [Hyphomonadaceae bacterium]